MRSEQQFARCAFLGLLVLLALSQAAMAASTTGLADWCVNVNGDTSTACNGAGSGGVDLAGNTVNLGGFDTTLESTGTNNLPGSITVTLNAGGYASFYADYDLDYPTYGSFQDSASINNALPADYSYEADDPNVSNIFDDFAGNTLTNNVSNVGTPSGPPTPCCDVAFALSVGGLNAGDVVVFTVSSTNPGGFYIQQTNSDQGDSIYLSAAVNPSATAPTPEPSTLILVALGGLSVLMSRRLCAVR